MEPFIGQIIMFGGTFAPRGWALCDGQLLAISSNSALFSILGTTYGGDGRTTFGLPGMRGRVPVHAGTGPGLPNVQLGARGGANQVTLAVNHLPSHTHPAPANSIDEDGNLAEPAGNNLAEQANNYHSGNPTGTLGAATTGPTGGGQAFDIRQPWIAVNFIISTGGYLSVAKLNRVPFGNRSFVTCQIHRPLGAGPRF